MIRLRDIFKTKARRQEETLPVDVADVLDPADDEALLLLMQDLGDLGGVRVPAAAKQRGWALVRTEVRAREARGAFKPAGQRLRGTLRSRRLALGSTAALVAIALGVVAVLQVGGPGRDPAVVDTSVTTATTALADNPSTTQEPSSTTGGTSTTTKPVKPSTTAPAPSSTSGSTATTHGPTVTTAPPPVRTTEPRTSTTVPATSTTEPASTTTSQQLMTAQERERSARAAAVILAEAVVAGDTDLASSVLSDSAKPRLVQLVASLHDVESYQIISVQAADPKFSKVLVQFTDDTADLPGQPATVTKRFLFELRVDQSGAWVVGIYSVPAE